MLPFSISSTLESFFFLFSALLVAGGTNATQVWPVTGGNYDYTTSVELLLMDPQTGEVTKRCSLPDLPENRNDHTVDGNMVCGGRKYTSPYKFFDNCISLQTGGVWTETHKLITRRYKHSSWQSSEGVVLLGGWDSSIGILNTAELVEKATGNTKKLFDLQYGFT